MLKFKTRGKHVQLRKWNTVNSPRKEAAASQRTAKLRFKQLQTNEHGHRRGKTLAYEDGGHAVSP